MSTWCECRFVDGNGMPMPPCIVMEKGESLDRWVRRNHRDMDQFTCMQVRTLPTFSPHQPLL